jgi:hypothetical protein
MRMVALIGGMVSQLEKQVSSLLDSASDSNLMTVQNELTALFNRADSDFDALEKYGKLALKMIGNLGDDQKVLLLLAAALEMEWPEYQGGDGYWICPSDLSSAATLLGLKNGNESLIEFSKKLNPCTAILYFDLGLAAVSGASPSQVIFATNRSTVDPVLAIASLSESLNKSQILETLEKLDQGVWLAAALVGANGWTWPEWQNAFDQVSGASRVNSSFVEVLLTQVGKSNSEDSSALKWIPEFIEEFESFEGFYEDPSGILNLIVSNKKLLKLAKDTQWEGLIEALEEDFPEVMSDDEPELAENFPLEEVELAKFCTNCGAKFARAESRFCPDCGTER